MTLIGVKSKYGSCNGNCTGLIIFNKKIFFIKKFIKKKEGSVCWSTGWAVNSMAISHQRFDSFSS